MASEDDDWRDDAACKGEPIETFFPRIGMTSVAAKAICAKCPVTSECWKFAEETGTLHGIWAGRFRGRVRN